MTVAGGRPTLDGAVLEKGPALRLWSRYLTLLIPDQTDLIMLGQTFSLNWNRKVGQKWSFSAWPPLGIDGSSANYFTSNGLGMAALCRLRLKAVWRHTRRSIYGFQLASALTGATASPPAGQAPSMANVSLWRRLTGAIYTFLRGGVRFTPAPRQTARRTHFRGSARTRRQISDPTDHEWAVRPLGGVLVRRRGRILGWIGESAGSFQVCRTAIIEHQLARSVGR